MADCNDLGSPRSRPETARGGQLPHFVGSRLLTAATMADCNDLGSPRSRPRGEQLPHFVGSHLLTAATMADCNDLGSPRSRPTLSTMSDLSEFISPLLAFRSSCSSTETTATSLIPE